MGWIGAKIFVDSLKAASYPHCISFRFWKTNIQDEGIREICDFLSKFQTVLCLELIDNKITSLGCEFLSKTLSQGPQCPPVMILRLDHNNLESNGINILADGIKENINLKELSL